MHTLIVGFGLTGQSVARFFLQQNKPFYLFDTRENPPKHSLAIPEELLFTKNFPETLFSSIKEVIVSPGLDPNTPIFAAAKRYQKPIIGDIELFARHAKAKIIGITGSNGKSTTTKLTRELIESSGQKSLMGGNIGIPAMDLLQHPSPDVYVLELSSFQLELKPNIHFHSAALLNLSDNHYDRHRNRADYLAAKLHIFDHCQTAVIHSDLLAEVSPRLRVQAIQPFGEKTKAVANVENGMIHLWGKPLAHCQTLSKGLFGNHQLQNVLAALSLVSTLEINPLGFAKVLQHFEGLPYRCQLIHQAQGTLWVNDSKSTTIAATTAAIHCLLDPTQRLILIAGGIGKGQDFSNLEAALTPVDEVILFGQDRALIAQSLIKKTHQVETLPAAVNLAIQLCTGNEKILFSPACASFDQFKDYQHRGEVFNSLIPKLNSPH